MSEIKLPPNETYPYRTMEWEKIDGGTYVRGIADIREARTKTGRRTISRYLIVEDDGIKDRRAFRLIKSGSGEKYGVQPSPIALCECTGFLQYGDCKHLQIVRLLLDRGHLPPVKGGSSV